MPKYADLGHWDTLPYEDDLVAQAWVGAFPEGMTLTDAAMVLGCSRELIRRTEANALRKLKRLALHHAEAFAHLRGREDIPRTVRVGGRYVQVETFMLGAPPVEDSE